MTSPDPFWRAAVLALAWCLVGLGIDTGAQPQGHPAPVATPTTQVSVGTPGHFASARTSDADSERSNTVTRPISPR